MALVVVAGHFAEAVAGRVREGRELGVARQITVGQVDVGAIRNGPGQTGDRLSGELGRAVVSGEGDGRVLAQTADRVGVDAVQADTETDEGTDAPGRIAEVIDDVGHQGGRGDVAFRRVARTGGGRDVAQALRARDGAHGADVARAVAAFQFNAPVGVEAVTKASKRSPAVVHFPVPVGTVGRRLSVDVVDDVIAGVDCAVPAVRLSRSGASRQGQSRRRARCQDQTLDAHGCGPPRSVVRGRRIRRLSHSLSALP
ncbi:hypothetical protein D3C71_624360 [compost metagenome]